MKTLSTILLMVISYSLFSQSYFNQENQSSKSLAVNYLPDENLDFTTLKYIISSNGKLDITPALSYGSSSFGFDVFTAGLSTDYYLLKQKQSLPLSLSLGAGYTLLRLSGFGESEIAHTGLGRVGLFHNISAEKIQIVPKVYYVFQFDIEDPSNNGDGFDIGVGLSYQLNNNNLITLTPGVLIGENDTQFQIELAYLFGRSTVSEN